VVAAPWSQLAADLPKLEVAAADVDLRPVGGPHRRPRLAARRRRVVCADFPKARLLFFTSRVE
jgi:hypothetical protein